VPIGPPVPDWTTRVAVGLRLLLVLHHLLCLPQSASYIYHALYIYAPLAWISHRSYRHEQHGERSWFITLPANLLNPFSCEVPMETRLQGISWCKRR
jgi:hypothetical protein